MVRAPIYIYTQTRRQGPRAYVLDCVCALCGVCLCQLGVVDESTLIVTSIRDEQLVTDIPTDKMLRHDVPVDVICTPTQVPTRRTHRHYT